MINDEMTKALVTRAEVEALVIRNLCAIKENLFFYKISGTVGSSEMREELNAWSRIKDFIDVGAISGKRVHELVNQILVKKVEEEFLRMILEKASAGKLHDLLNHTNIQKEDVIHAVQDFLHKLACCQENGHTHTVSEG